MSIVSNYQLKSKQKIQYIGDYTTHRGTPSILRSDSMLKAIGKAINTRVNPMASHIPFIVLGNSPISQNYAKKVDDLKQMGVLQGFYSMNPTPTTKPHLRETPLKGFVTIESKKQLNDLIKDLLNTNLQYFSTMIAKKKLGNIIAIAALEKTDTKRAEKFIKLIQE